MIRIAIVDDSPVRRGSLRDAVMRCAEQISLKNTAVVAFATVAELAASCAVLRAGYYDLALCSADGDKSLGQRPASAKSATEEICELRDSYPELPLILTSRYADAAMTAYDLGLSIIMLPGTIDDMLKILHASLPHSNTRRVARLAIKTASGVDAVALDNIQFVESSKRGPIVHLPGGGHSLARGTLRSLYTQLERVRINITERPSSLYLSPEGDQSAPHLQPFVMAGNSFIVNLDNVRASGKGALVFADGETIIIPTRKRKEVEAALEAYRSR